MSRFLEKFGIYRGNKNPCVLFVGSNAAAFDDIAGLINGICDREMRLGVSLLCMEEQGRAAIGQRFPHAKIIARPTGGATAFSAMLSTLKARVVVAIGRLPKKFEMAIANRSTPLIDWREVTGKPVTEVTDEIVRLVGRERRWEERKNRPLGRFLADRIHARILGNNGRTGLGGHIRRFNEIGQLKTRLGNPKVIMCLGNGPSSEDENLAEMPYDVLFRANHVWIKRRHLDQPDMVFTGMQASMKKVRNAIFAVLGDTTEKVLLMTRAKNFVLGKLEYCVAGGASELVQLETNENFRPTSGAIMLCVAVALEPQQLIVAGMDMFRHPDGAYPGDAVTSNTYTATHSHDHELGFILSQLERFEGELHIVSPVLLAEWQNHQKSKGQQA